MTERNSVPISGRMKGMHILPDGSVEVERGFNL